MASLNEQILNFTVYSVLSVSGRVRMPIRSRYAHFQTGLKLACNTVLSNAYYTAIVGVHMCS